MPERLPAPALDREAQDKRVCKVPKRPRHGVCQVGHPGFQDDPQLGMVASLGEVPPGRAHDAAEELDIVQGEAHRAGGGRRHHETHARPQEVVWRGGRHDGPPPGCQQEHQEGQKGISEPILRWRYEEPGHLGQALGLGEGGWPGHPPALERLPEGEPSGP